MNSKPFIIFGAVITLALVCFAQDGSTGQDQPRPTAASTREEAQVRAAFEQQRRAAEAARAAQEAEANKPSPVYRVQFMLLEIKPETNSPKAKELRDFAQSSRKSLRLLALADELIASGEAKATSNLVATAREGYAARVKSNETVPYMAKSKTAGSPQVSIQGGAHDRSTRIEYRCRSKSNDIVAVEFTIEQASYPDRLDVEGYRGSSLFNCSSDWEGKSGDECVLIADSPRQTGSTETIKPVERYLLFRLDRLE